MIPAARFYEIAGVQEAAEHADHRVSERRLAASFGTEGDVDALEQILCEEAEEHEVPFAEVLDAWVRI